MKCANKNEINGHKEMPKIKLEKEEEEYNKTHIPTRIKANDEWKIDEKNRREEIHCENFCVKVCFSDVLVVVVTERLMCLQKWFSLLSISVFGAFIFVALITFNETRISFECVRKSALFFLHLAYSHPKWVSFYIANGLLINFLSILWLFARICPLP